MKALFASLGLLLASSPAFAVIVWNEAVNGELTGNRLAPQSISFSAGINSILATSVAGDREYFTFTLSPGLQLTGIFLASYAGLDTTAFIGVQSGTTFTEPDTGTNVANLLGYAHFGPGMGNVGTDVLDDIGTGDGAIGFTPPLPSGSYTFWMQQTGGNSVDYQFDFQVIPEPATVGAMLGGAALLSAAILRRRRRRRSPVLEGTA